MRFITSLRLTFGLWRMVDDKVLVLVIVCVWIEIFCFRFIRNLNSSENTNGIKNILETCLIGISF